MHLNDDLKITSGRVRVRKILMTMKIATLINFLVILQAAAAGFGQEQPLTLDCHGDPIKSVFDQIEQQSSYRFFYNDNYIDLNKRVDLKSKKSTVEDLLNDLLVDANLTYRILDNNLIVITPRDESLTGKEGMRQGTFISGEIKDIYGNPLPGVNVLVKGTTTGTISDNQGKYSLEVPHEDAILVFSYVGYTSQEVPINNRTSIDIILEEEVESLDEVVVIGYGTVKKANLTNAVARISSDVFQERPVTSLSEAFSGQIAGVYAQQSSGLPGKDFEIKIRGTNTITSGTGPLYVVDGMPVSDITGINMSNVASIEVLKDAAASAIYGARGAGGIVLISTRTAKPGDTKIDFDVYTGVQTISNKIPLMNADQWVEWTEWYFKENYLRDGKGDPFTDPSITPEAMGKKYQTHPFWYDEEQNQIMTNTDWQDEGLQPAMKNNYQLTLTKGLEDGSFLISGNYMNQDGLLKGTGYNRYNFRSNAQYDINRKIEVGMNLSASHSIADGYTNGEGKESPYMRLIVADPTVPADMNIRSTKFGLITNDPNPILQSERILDITKTTKTLGNVFANYQIIEGLKLGGMYGLEIRNDEFTYFKPMDLNKKERREGLFSNRNNNRYLAQGTLSYDRTFKNHTIGLLLGSSYEQAHTKFVSLESRDFASDDIPTFNTAATFLGWDDVESEWSLLSYFGRAMYNFADRYIASASLRRDGSSRFGEDNKFGWFPSASAAWRISQEEFLRNRAFISNLKIRASWGKTGNDMIGNYRSFGTLSNYNYAFDGELVFGFAPTSPDNPNLSWETTTTTDIGLDVSLFRNRFTLAADYYVNNTTNLLLEVPSPAITGFPGSITLNSGSVRNKGWELELSSVNVQSSSLVGIQWRSSMNISHNRNEVTSLGYGIKEIIGELNSVPTHVTRVGLPVRSFYLYDNIGILSEADIADESVAKFNNQEAGNEKIKDVNNDGVINDDDRTVIGSNHPEFILGIDNRLQVGDFDLSFLLTGATGFYTYFYLGRYIDNGQTNRNQMDNWVNCYRSATQPGDGKTPYPFGVNPEFSDRWLYRGDYFRVKNITLGYTVPIQITSRIKVRSFRAYVSMDNLLNITEYPGGNPETNEHTAGSIYEQGADYGTFPLTRTFVLGVKLGF